MKDQNMNVMLTCAGRRNYLVRFFQAALQDRGLVLAGDASLAAPALQEADASFLLPSVNHCDYLNELLTICKQKQVRLLISLNDLELPILAKNRDLFLRIGTFPVVSSPEVIDICFDKWETFLFLDQIGISTPKTYLSLAEAHQALMYGNISFPLIVKPRWGSASIGIQSVDDYEEMDLAYRYVRKLLSKSFLADVCASDFEKCVLIQEQLLGQEYGLDVINDLNGSYVTTFVKRKLGMRAGETDRAVTVENAQLNELGKKIGDKLKHIGNLDCDVFVGEKGYSVLEMNPRFGGGYPFSHIAGANLPAALIAWLNEENVNMAWLKVRENVQSSKFDQLVITSSQDKEAQNGIS